MSVAIAVSGRRCSSRSRTPGLRSQRVVVFRAHPRPAARDADVPSRLAQSSFRNCFQPASTARPTAVSARRPESHAPTARSIASTELSVPKTAHP